MKLKIYINSFFLSERKYILSTLFEFVNIEYEIFIDNTIKDYILSYEDCVIKVKDGFFSLQEKGEYMKVSNIPKEPIKLSSCEWFSNLLFLYGENCFEITDKTIYCGGDIFGSAFFMLTRWEELILPKDKFGRCDENEMFVVKHNLYKRPLVNEYIELLIKMLECVGGEMKNDKQRYHPFITHDVDDLFRLASFKNFCKNIVGDILHRKSIVLAVQTLWRFWKYHIGKIKDPFDTFDEIMNWSERFGLKDAFYFMPTYKREYDARYDIRDKRVKQIIENVVKRGHEVGIHPSKITYNNFLQFQEEVKRLRNIYDGIDGGRQHYLLYSLPMTLKMWEECELKYDAGLGFAFRGGFRCGICFPYPFFNVLERKNTSLIIRPLIVMEVALLRYKMSKNQIKREIFDLADIVRRYNGEFVFLWHTDNLYRQLSERYMEMYKEIVNYISQ